MGWVGRETRAYKLMRIGMLLEDAEDILAKAQAKARRLTRLDATTKAHLDSLMKEADRAIRELVETMDTLLPEEGGTALTTDGSASAGDQPEPSDFHAAQIARIRAEEIVHDDR